MKNTQKRLAAVNQAKALAIRGATTMESDKLYERLEGAGYWWNQSTWTNEPRPRSKRIGLEGAGANPDLVEFRITAQGDKLPFINEALRALGAALGWTFVQQSEGYENRNQEGLDDPERRVRVYSSFIMPKHPTVPWGMDDNGVWVGSPDQRIVIADQERDDG